MDGTRRRRGLEYRKEEHANINSLGEDLLVEILLILPVKYLLRCRSVSKTWYTLTKTDSFTSTHFLHHSPYRSNYRNHNSLFLSLVPMFENRLENASGISLLCDEKEKTSLLRLPFVPVDGNRGKYLFILFGSSNGLVCLEIVVGSEKTFTVVWNPATEQYKCLPYCDVPFRDKLSIFQVLVGPLIGFDLVRNGNRSEYKVVRIFQDRSLHDKKLTFGAQVFVQNSNSWRLVKNKSDELEYDCISRGDTSITLNGVLYWKIEKGFFSMMSFDLRDEVFKMIQLPEQMQEHKLFLWKESLACLDYESVYGGNFHNESAVLWLMNSSNHVWTPQLNFKINRDCPFSMYRPDLFLGSWKDKFIFASVINKDVYIDDKDYDELVVACMRPKRVFSYDPKTQTGAEILEHEVVDDIGRTCGAECLVTNYVESLAPV